jgi:hypothetical protein
MQILFTSIYKVIFYFFSSKTFLRENKKEINYSTENINFLTRMTHSCFVFMLCYVLHNIKMIKKNFLHGVSQWIVPNHKKRYVLLMIRNFSLFMFLMFCCCCFSNIYKYTIHKTWKMFSLFHFFDMKNKTSTTMLLVH